MGKSEKEILLDKVFAFYYQKPGAYFEVIGLARHNWNVTDRVLLDAVIDELYDRELITASNYSKYSFALNHAGQEIGDKYENFSDYLSSQKREQIFQQRKTTTKTVISIGFNILFGFLTLLLTWLSYKDDKTIDEQKEKINELELVIDSLLTNRPNLINQKKDSLK
ncbi:hypothetical protein [Zunongwangia sp. HGR-M22]|uniref:hypothetical protein n=1 Tax=Zunongwangia sp. HGR-M22 TaxID=3015168 RepID=UPI0022DDC83C|nr:hypothetical protein [Zunongwangia sp. HGR-M22]WBL25086.1 hypothetical protein PBT91_14430 [Zunongwangia sp. HGR-M22]